MEHNPVQIVLNSQNYVTRVDPLPGGKNRDFFGGKDKAFVEHKKELAKQFNAIADAAALAGVPLQYVRVEMQEVAWAKSHRPTKALFPAGKFRTLGGNELGSLIVEISTEELKQLVPRMLTAEETTNLVLNDNTGKMEAKPSRLRSEIGAVRGLRAYEAQDRRKFSLDQALTWLSDVRTGGAYYVEGFVDENKDSGAALDLWNAFKLGLHRLNLPIEIAPMNVEWSRSTILVVKLPSFKAVKDDKDARRVHADLLNFLDRNPAVRSILLPPVLQASANPRIAAGKYVGSLPDPVFDYPAVGIIDTGVGANPHLLAWMVGSLDFLDIGGDQDRSHGAFIAGLLFGGVELNSGASFSERPCKFFDLDLHPTTDYEQYYPRGFLDFIGQMEIEIQRARAQGVRVFNMSLSVTLPVEDTNYGLFANALDFIADKHDVIFVLPAGNLDAAILRDEWPENPDNCLQMLAEYRHQGRDKIFQPGDSLRSVVVGAVDPSSGGDFGGPSRYSRRGPGPSLGAKPDLAHIGGRYGEDAGLRSLTPDGAVVEGCGTSYASPLVARTLAVMDKAIDGEIPREALIALAIHGAKRPDILSHKKLQNVARHFVGAGVPSVAGTCLSGPDNEITLVFNGTLMKNDELHFDFSWPSSLVTAEGKCRGDVKMTLAYRPPIDRQFGAEFVLVNVDAWLKQEVIDPESGEITFKSRLSNLSDHGIEKERVSHGAKWWPVKRFEQGFKGVGASSQWRLALDSLSRSGYSFPDEGVAFSVVLTIGDKRTSAPIFDEVRQQLQSSGVRIDDIKVGLASNVRIKN